MNKTALKNFAIAARLELLQRVMNRANLYGVSEETCKSRSFKPSSGFQKLGGELLTREEEVQRDALIRRVNLQGYRQTMEEAAYTWFNRFIALRYMQEHQLLPISQRVLPEVPGQMPEIIREAHQLSLDGIDTSLVLDLLDRNDNTTLYRYLLISLCNTLHDPLPQMFEKISDYTELLFPDGLLKDDSVLAALAKIPAEDFQDIQVIGWLYQYYITDINTLVYDGSMSKSRIPKELLPAATQIFTPDWAVKYMTENSLGRLWLEGHPDDSLRAKWRYYIDEGRQDSEAVAKLAEIRKSYAAMQPDQITVLDPCMGSGHILVYAFDVLMDIYRSMGYTDRDAAQSIVENNLYGLDIDDRAAQLAYFAVMMKACEYDRRFLRRGAQPHVYAMQESARIDEQKLNCLGAEKQIALQLLSAFTNAKEYGSILHVDIAKNELERLTERLKALRSNNNANLIDMADTAETIAVIEPLLVITDAMIRKYDVVITNPPYLGSSRFSPSLADYVNNYYSEGKTDLSTVMYLKSMNAFTKPEGFMSFITITSWMFLSSFEKFRTTVLNKQSIVNLVDFGSELFDGKVGHNLIAAWVARNIHVSATMTAVRLVDYNYSRRDEKEYEFFKTRNYYTAQQENFKKIPGMPVAYWVSEAFIAMFTHLPLGTISRPRVGQNTGDNSRFLRLWFEIKYGNITFGLDHDEMTVIPYKWLPYNKGGEYRRWYGNQEYVINWKNDGKEIKDFAIIRNHGKHWSRYIQNVENMCKEGVTWSFITSGNFSTRLLPVGFICDVAGSAIFPNERTILPLLALTNSKISTIVLSAINPTINMQAGNIASVPVSNEILDNRQILSSTKSCVGIASSDWDSFETSWDFKKHPLI